MGSSGASARPRAGGRLGCGLSLRPECGPRAFPERRRGKTSMAKKKSSVVIRLMSQAGTGYFYTLRRAIRANQEKCARTTTRNSMPPPTRGRLCAGRGQGWALSAEGAGIAQD